MFGLCVPSPLPDVVVLDTVDIFNLKTKSWRAAKNRLPYRIVYATLVRYRDTFILVGGAPHKDSMGKEDILM